MKTTMIKVFVHENPTMVALAKATLEQANIPCHIRNEFAGGGVGELAFTDTWPELWVDQDADIDQVHTLLNTLTQTKQHNAWQCTTCSETNDASFDFCWQCQSNAPDTNTQAP